jgi:hypothetical protein
MDIWLNSILLLDNNEVKDIMRATEYLFLVVMIGVFSWLVWSGVGELNTSFEENQINITGLEGDYNKIENIQQKANESIENFKTLGNTEKSWFQKIGAGIIAIPYAVISFPIMIIESIVILQKMAVDSLGGVVPAIVLLAILTFITVEVVKRFLEFFQRTRA